MEAENAKSVADKCFRNADEFITGFIRLCTAHSYSKSTRVRRNDDDIKNKCREPKKD